MTTIHEPPASEVVRATPTDLLVPATSASPTPSETSWLHISFPATTAPDRFESMPQELHFNVLSQMSSPEDVLSTIQASPSAFKAFNNRREQIYACVIETALVPEVFRELLAILNAPDHNECPCIGPLDQVEDPDFAEWRAWELRVLSFLRMNANGAAYPIPVPHTDTTKFRKQIDFITRLYFCLAKFVDFYPAFVRSIAAGELPTIRPACRSQQQAQDCPRLTDTELLRLQRGILRHELCCRLVGLPSKIFNCNGDSSDAFMESTSGPPDIWWDAPFGGLLPNDELEEISSASQYLEDLYQMYHSDVREELSKDLRALARRRRGTAIARDGSETEKTIKDWLEQARDEHKMPDYFTNAGARSWTTSLSHLGIVFLDRVTKSSPQERRELLRSTFTTWEYLATPSFQPLYDLDTPFGRSPTFGTYCSPVVRTLMQEMLKNDDGFLPGNNMRHLRALGWAFFDDQSKLGPLGLHNAEAFTQCWLTKHQNFCFPSQPRIPASVLNTYISKNEWEAEIISKYSCEDHSDDYYAMKGIVSGVRAVVDFNSARLPTFDEEQEERTLHAVPTREV